MIIESDNEESIESLQPGTRFFVIRFFDGSAGIEAAAATSLDPTDLDRVDQICSETGVPFNQGVAMAAVRHLAHRLWEDEEPEGTEIHDVTEVSKRELLHLMRLSRERMAEAGQS